MLSEKDTFALTRESERKRAYYKNNRERILKRQKEYYQENKDKIRLRSKAYDKREAVPIRLRKIKNRYGLSPEQYNAMLTEQKGICAIYKKEHITWLCVDHNHLTGKIRGLLCPRCNQIVAWIENNKEVIIEAGRYLIKYEDYFI